MMSLKRGCPIHRTMVKTYISLTYHTRAAVFSRDISSLAILSISQDVSRILKTLSRFNDRDDLTRVFSLIDNGTVRCSVMMRFTI